MATGSKYGVYVQGGNFIGVVDVREDKAEAERIAATMLGLSVNTPAGMPAERIVRSWVEPLAQVR